MSEGPWIQVWARKQIIGLSSESDWKRLFPQNPIQLIDALRKLHNGDAHFVPYIVVDHEGEPKHPSFQRINKPGLPTLRARGFDVQFEVIVFDVDDPAKDESSEASSAWRTEQSRRYHQLPSELKTGLAWARTRGGFRYIGCLPRALKPEEYELYHQAFSAALGEYGIQVDSATKDWTRCYRLPRVIRDGVKQDYPMDLGPLDELMAFEPSMKKPRKPKRASARLDHNGVQPIAEGEPLSEALGEQLLAELEAKKPLPRFKSGKLRFTPDSLNRLLHEFPPLVSLVSFDEFTGATFIIREVPGQAGRSSRGFPRKIETHDELALGAQQICDYVAQGTGRV